MKTYTPDSPSLDIRLLVYGCSWTYHWPGYLDRVASVEWENMGGGRSLYWIGQQLAKRDDLATFDRIIVQLPTPIRSVDAGRGSLIATHKCLEWFLTTFTGAGQDTAEHLLLRRYFHEIEHIAGLHDRVAFFAYSVGGYPFRSPYDFGEYAQANMIGRLETHDIAYIVQDFSGLPGFAKLEHKGKRPKGWSFVRNGEEFVPGSSWHTVNPPGLWVEDPHPNKRADLTAARTVEEYLCANR